MGWLYDDTPNALYHFILLMVLGAAGAIASGRAIAATWRPYTIVPVYMVVLSGAICFLHYALFQEDLLSIRGFVVALVITLLASAFGYRSRRAEQMSTQYSWIYSKAGPLGWSQKGS